jgi:hypothetical protein
LNQKTTILSPPSSGATHISIVSNRDTIFCRTIGELLWTTWKKEGDIYALLESKGIPNIALFGKGNDLRNHTTHASCLSASFVAPTSPARCISAYLSTFASFLLALHAYVLHLSWRILAQLPLPLG